MINDCLMIGFCGTTMHKEPIGPVIDTLAKRVAQHSDYRLLVYHCFEDLYYDSEANVGAATIFDAINYDMLDIMVLMQFSDEQGELFAKIARRCHEHGVPIVNIDRRTENAFNVFFGYGEAFSKIVEHVICEHGVKRVKMVAGIENNEFSQTRIDSCAEVMARYGLELKSGDVMYGGFWEQPTYDAMDKFFADGEELPDAFICANDSMAMAVCLKLTEKGYSVPKDVIVTGFDGIELEQYHDPRLTTAIRNNDELVDAVMEVIANIAADPAIEPYDTELGYAPVFTESCGCCNKVQSKGNRVLADYVRNYTYAKVFEEHMDSMSNKVAATPTLENACDILRSYTFNSTAICVTKDFYKNMSADAAVGESDTPPEYSGDYPDTMRVLIDCFKDRASIEGVEFKTTEILPNLFNHFGENNSLLVIPLHSQENIIGYMVTYVVHLKLHNDQLYSLNMATNRCLEMVRTHERLRILNHQLEYLFTHDRLTNIYNRYGFYNNFKQQFTDTQGDGREVFIVSIDLNDMKYINDNFGHSAGDEALCITAKALTEACDGENIICSRFGGDEFVVARICSNAAERGKCYHARFDKALADLNRASDAPYQVAASVGVYSASLADVDTIDSLIELADKLMYNDKARHKRRPKGVS